MQKLSVQSNLLTSLPDDRPITSIQIVENISQCPKGFYPVLKTYDQDLDADLRESSIFKISAARYLCLSKSEGLPTFVVQELTILNDKVAPPRGYSLLNRTVDTSQRAWKKKQLCYRLVNVKDVSKAITDIIVCSRLKKAPVGFTLAGELNGVIICYKMGNVQDGGSGAAPPTLPPKPTTHQMYPALSGDDNSDHDYEILLPPGTTPYTPPSLPNPTRPAPKPPGGSIYSHNTLGSTFQALDGVPFIVNPKFLPTGGADKMQFPKIKPKSMQQIMKEYEYSFSVERQT